MDSTNGHSEKNPDRKKEEKIRFKQTGNLRKIDISDLPFKDQEQIREMMAMIGDDEEPELYVADFTIEVDDLDILPIDFLADMYRDAIVDGEYEKAKDLGEEIKKREYAIDISEKFITLRKIT
jgi:hypothetical protein